MDQTRIIMMDNSSVHNCYAACLQFGGHGTTMYTICAPRHRRARISLALLNEVTSCKLINPQLSAGASQINLQFPKMYTHAQKA